MSPAISPARVLTPLGRLKLIGGISKGHPDDKDLEAARNFIKGIVK